MKLANYKNLFYTLVFGTLTGVVVAVALSVFIPKFFTPWAGGLVCPGRIEFLTFKQTYYCFTSANDSFDIGDAMYWAVFRRFIFLTVAAGILLVAGFMRAARFMYERRAAAGF